MQKYFCDRCGQEMGFDSVHVEYTSEESIIGREYAFKQLCPPCKKEFIGLLNGFIPNFMGSLTKRAADGRKAARQKVSLWSWLFGGSARR
jgi:hypothetical protein